jgi:hypothetical protein
MGLSESYAIQPTMRHIISLKSILISSSNVRLGLSSDLLSGSAIKILHAFVFSNMRATCPAQLNLFYFLIVAACRWQLSVPQTAVLRHYTDIKKASINNCTISKLQLLLNTRLSASQREALSQQLLVRLSL